MENIQLTRNEFDLSTSAQIRKPSFSLFATVALTVSFSLFSSLATAQEVLNERGQLPGQDTIKKAWEFEATASSYKSMVDYTDWVGVVGGEVTYNKVKDFNLKAGLDYAFVYDSEVSTTEATRYGIQDLELTAIYKDLIDGPTRTLRPVAKVYLPTSETSQNATMMTTVAAGISYSQVLRYFNVGSSHLLLGSLYQYETSDATGSDYNSPLGMSNSVNISRGFGKVSLVASYSMTTYYNYASNFVNIQTFLSSINWQVRPDLTITGYYRWRDDIYSYLSAFDDDTSITGLSLTYTM